ncbi:MAG: hypothetical protein DMD41_16470 [Gemmatimonadetes bacterium]|nr:MAG: hypothetical protein DMD41_16470 [Gemmatimonadota bacterium]
MWDLAVREGDYARADSLIRRLSRTPFSGRALDAFARGDSTARARILDEAKLADRAAALPDAAEFIAVYLEDFARAEQFLHLALAPRQKPSLRASAHQLLGTIQMSQGRWSAATAAYDSAEGLGAPDVGREGRAWVATLPFLAVPRRQVEAALADVARWAPSAAAQDRGLRLSGTLRPGLRLYLLGLLSSRLGADADALRHATELERADVPPVARAVTRAWAQTVRADVAWRRHRPADALAALQGVRGEIPLELDPAIDPGHASTVTIEQRLYSEEHARYLRAEVLHELGRDEEARHWLETAFQNTPSELTYLAPYHLGLAQIYQRMGERAKAADHYSRFIELWKDCDPELRPIVADAKARLTTVTGESPRTVPHGGPP